MTGKAVTPSERHQGPFYTIEEALEITGLKPSELRFHIENDEVVPVVYTGSRQFLIFSPRDPKAWLGIAHCHYRGHMTVYKSYALDLLDGNPVTLNKGWGILIEADKLAYVNYSCPFKNALPMTPMGKWYSGEPATDESLIRFPATPLPKETKTGAKVMTELLDTIQKLTQPGNQTKDIGSIAPELTSGPQYRLEFKTNSVFTPESLRISSSEVNRFKKQKTTNNKSIAKDAVTRAAIGKKRLNIVHDLIDLILKENTGINSTGVWEILKNECNNDSPAYDTDGILFAVDSQVIEWVNIDGKQKSMTRKTLQNIVSKKQKSLTD